MEQPAVLSIFRTETNYRFRLDLPDGPVGQEYSTELTADLRERLRRIQQAAIQSFQPATTIELKRQTVNVGTMNDAVFSLGRFLFDTLLPAPIQESLRMLDSSALILRTNTPDIPWELMVDGNAKSKQCLCQALSIGRLILRNRESMQQRPSSFEHSVRKANKRDTQGLCALFLVNPTGERPTAEEEVAILCTCLPESVSRIILYRQQANQLEMRMRMNAEAPHILHYAGPLPSGTGTNEPTLALAGNSRLDGSSLEHLLQGLPKPPLIFLSYHEEERHSRNSGYLNQEARNEQTERLAGNMLAAGAGAVIAMRWPIPAQQTREFMTLFYQDIADGIELGEALRRTRVAQAQHHSDDTSWTAFVLYGDPTQRLVTSSPLHKERPIEPPFDPFDDSQIMSPLFPLPTPWIVGSYVQCWNLH